jgi:predicted nucleic acid-binding protein
MTLFLVDTNVVSELRKPRPHPAVLAWLEATATNRLRLSAATIGELQAGIELTRKPNPDRARELEAWLEDVIEAFDILAVDESVFRQWARLMRGQSSHLLIDALIAATAQVHDLTVVTRNERDFVSLGVTVLNPFQTHS